MPTRKVETIKKALRFYREGFAQHTNNQLCYDAGVPGSMQEQRHIYMLAHINAERAAEIAGLMLKSSISVVASVCRPKAAVFLIHSKYIEVYYICTYLLIIFKLWFDMKSQKRIARCQC